MKKKKIRIRFISHLWGEVYTIYNRKKQRRKAGKMVAGFRLVA